MNKNDKYIENIYSQSEVSLPVSPGSPCLADAVHFGTNRARPIHRWFNFKEGFSADLLHILGIDTGLLRNPENTFLDPFCGSGTTLLAGDLEHGWKARRLGIEVNPLIAFVADTKVQWRQYNPDRLRRAVDRVLAEPLAKTFDSVSLPALSTFHNPDIFEESRLSSLLDAVQRVHALEIPEKAAMLLGIAAAAERVGKFRRDGRALRILRSPSELREREAASVATILSETWSMMREDLDNLLPYHSEHSVSPAIVLKGDGRTLDASGADGLLENVAMIAYSPPYLNHIDYTEVYKVELWLLGFVTSQSQMLSLRKQTFRSHASIAIAPTNPSLPKDVDEAVQLASEMIVRHGTAWHQNFPRLSRAYLADIQTSLSHQLAVLQPGGHSICVVANSSHGAKDHRVPVAVDIWIARIAQELGFEVERFVVARQLSRRNHLNRFLRETAIVLRKP